MSGAKGYGVDLTPSDIYNLVLAGKLVFAYSGKVPEGDIKALKAGMKFDYPFPVLVFVRGEGERYRVLVGEKLIEALVKFMPTEDFRQLQMAGSIPLFRVVMLDSCDPIDRVFPAHAGVILVCCRKASRGACFPRTRGGDPIRPAMIISAMRFSPHTRG